MFYICLNQKQYIMTLEQIEATAKAQRESIVQISSMPKSIQAILIHSWIDGYLKGKNDGIDKAKELISKY